jgi:hypothetical protein
VFATAPGAKKEPAGPGGSPQPLSGELFVDVSSPNGKPKLRLRMDEEGALPVRPEELIHVHARLNQPAYIYLLWLDGKGEVTALYPWNEKTIVDDVTLPPPARPPTREVHSPLPSPRRRIQGWEADKSTGLETVLLLARRTPWPKDRSLADFVGKVPAGELNHPLEVAILNHDRARGVGKTEWDRNRGIEKQAKEIDAPMLQFMARLASEFEVVRAVRFAHVGK